MVTADGADWLDAVRQVVAAVRSSDVTELEVANASFSVRVRREPAAPAGPGTSLGSSVGQDARLQRVLAPFTGVFFRAPTPSARPYTNEGEWIEADAIIGLVETRSEEHTSNSSH